MQSQYLAIVVRYLLFLVSVLAFSCDKIHDDTKPQIEQRNEYFTRPSAPFIVNMANRHAIAQNTIFRLKNTSTKGTAQFLGRNFLVYTPNESNQNVADAISYETCTDGNCQEQTINVRILDANTSLQDSLNTCSQTNFSSLGAVYLNAGTLPQPINLFVSQNGFLCSNYNLSTFQVILAPTKGTIQPLQIPNTNIWVIRYTYNTNLVPQDALDYFIYRLTLNNGNVVHGVGLVYIGNNGNCPINAVFDQYNNLFQNQPFVANILQNDQYCPARLHADSLQAFRIITPPVAGQIIGRSLAGQFIVYRPNTGFIGTDSLRYRLKYANGATSQAWVRFRVP